MMTWIVQGRESVKIEGGSSIQIIQTLTKNEEWLEIL